MKKPNKIGLCLSGGGARGFAHLGVLQAIDELGISIDRLSGTSAGAFAAVLYAAGHSPSEILDFAQDKKLWDFISFRPNKWGLFSLKKTAAFFRKLIPHESFEQLEIPVSICTTNISRGVPEFFSSGDLIQAILASATVPLFFKPVIINGNKHVDGGLSNNLPMEALSNCDYKIAVDITPFEKRLPTKSVKDLLLKCVYIGIDNQNKNKRADADLLIIPEGIMHFDGFKMKNAKKIFDIGYQSALHSLKDLAQT